ncbi:uncharacterized protein LOC125178616 [Hyalella azteca]|uniref:Uncharacterized protein LOC125178616 n=1 Tax=Hyalella azteca TaxID=294128 RepID=A0A979FQM2_HYAAZ|nr:uncharacterized protein LOC125178616 [Hyalella azteca]
MLITWCHIRQQFPPPDNGSKFLCLTTVCPIKSEGGDSCVFIVNFDDLTSPALTAVDDGLSDSIQSKFNRARASFRQSFRMGSKRRGARSPRSSGSQPTTPGGSSRMDPILDQPGEENSREPSLGQSEPKHSTEEDSPEDHRLPGSGEDVKSVSPPFGHPQGGRSTPSPTSSPSKKKALPSEGGCNSVQVVAGTEAECVAKDEAKSVVAGASRPGVRGSTTSSVSQVYKEEDEDFSSRVREDESDQRDPLLGRMAGTGASLSSSTDPPALHRSGQRPFPSQTLQDSLATNRVGLAQEIRKASLPIWRRKDSSASQRKDSLATTCSRGSGPRLGSFAEPSECGGQVQMRPATSLDAISHNRVNLPHKGDTLLNMPHMDSLANCDPLSDDESRSYNTDVTGNETYDK